MKNLVLFLSALIIGTSSALATGTENKVAERNAYRFNDSFIFVEGGITFSVYPDGEFDFYIDNRVVGRRNGITFNSGFDYNPYVQYDDYGAVIQVENIPIYYDYYGRVTQIGNVDLNYISGRVRRIGGMNVFYNSRGFYDYHTGFINVYNRHYIFRPFHRFFIRPAIGFSLVFNRPYRRYYHPVRYTYYRPYRHNPRRAYAKIGKTHRYNKIRRERSQVYRNDKRVALRENAVRSNRNIAQRNGNVSRSNGVNKRDNRNINRQGNVVRSNGVNRTAPNRNGISRSDARKGNSYERGNTRSANRNGIGRSDARKGNSYERGNTRSANRVVQRSTTVRKPKRNSVTKRTVTQTPRSRTVTRSTKTYKAPNNQKKVATRSATSSRNTMKQAPSRSRSSVSTQRSSARRNIGQAPSRSSANKARTSATRSSRRY